MAAVLPASIAPLPAPASPARAEGRRARRLGWATALLGAPCAMAVLAASGMRIVPDSLLALLATLILLGAIHLVYSRFRAHLRIELASGVLAMMMATAMTAGIVSNAGLRLHRPLIDGLLSRADHAIGIDTPALVRAFVGQPILGEVLNLAYLSAFPLVFVAAFGLALCGRADRTWEIGWGFSACILVSSLVAAFYPAIGNIPYAHLEGLAGHGLPAGAGTFYVAAFHALYDGQGGWLDMRQLEGVVTFPSFHVVMGIIVAWAFRRTGILGWVAAIWCALVAISTIPIGGHYVVDLIGGTALWAACMRAARDGRAAPRG
jgi:membrane-associated phospholipid phosphatase